MFKVTKDNQKGIKNKWGKNNTIFASQLARTEGKKAIIF